MFLLILVLKITQACNRSKRMLCGKNSQENKTPFFLHQCNLYQSPSPAPPRFIVRYQKHEEGLEKRDVASSSLTLFHRLHTNGFLMEQIQPKAKYPLLDRQEPMMLFLMYYRESIQNKRFA